MLYVTDIPAIPRSFSFFPRCLGTSFPWHLQSHILCSCGINKLFLESSTAADLEQRKSEPPSLPYSFSLSPKVKGLIHCHTIVTCTHVLSTSWVTPQDAPRKRHRQRRPAWVDGGGHRHSLPGSTYAYSNGCIAYSPRIKCRNPRSRIPLAEGSTPVSAS